MKKQGHAVLGASSSPMWLACAEAGRALANAKSSTSIYAATGTLAHTVAEATLHDGKNPVKAGAMHAVDGYTIEINQEMLNAVEIYTDFINLLAGPSSQLMVEQKVSLAGLFPGSKPPQDVFGTADAVIVKGEVLHVVDFKYGSGVAIEASSPQLAFYALGALLGTPLWLTAREIRVHIVQPRAPHASGPIRSKTYSIAELEKFGDTVVDQVNLISSGGGGAVSGAHCRFCPIAGSCTELAKTNTALATTDFPDPIVSGPMPPNMLNADELGAIMERIPVFDTWIRAVENEALSRLMCGQSIPGYKLVDKRASRKWALEDDEVLEKLKEPQVLGDQTLLVARVSVLSPTQSEKRLDKGQWQRVLNAGLVEKKSSGLTIANVNDRRPAVVPVEGALLDFQGSDPDADDTSDVPF